MLLTWKFNKLLGLKAVHECNEVTVSLTGIGNVFSTINSTQSMIVLIVIYITAIRP